MEALENARSTPAPPPGAASHSQCLVYLSGGAGGCGAGSLMSDFTRRRTKAGNCGRHVDICVRRCRACLPIVVFFNSHTLAPCWMRTGVEDDRSFHDGGWWWWLWWCKARPYPCVHSCAIHDFASTSSLLATSRKEVGGVVEDVKVVVCGGGWVDLPSPVLHSSHGGWAQEERTNKKRRGLEEDEKDLLLPNLPVSDTICLYPFVFLVTGRLSSLSGEISMGQWRARLAFPWVARSRAIPTSPLRCPTLPIVVPVVCLLPTWPTVIGREA